MDRSHYAIRFGFGLPAPQDIARSLTGPDSAVETWPGPQQDEILAAITDYRAARRSKAEDRIKSARSAATALALAAVQATFARAVGSADPYRERLVAFWANHFTVAPRNRIEAVLPGLLVDQAIRPHVGGRFAEMLVAVTTHPAMLVYLNQDASFGPDSPKGKRQKKGLNENLARELLELHTLGVGADYAQSDVRALAELLTGLAVGQEGFVFDPRRAEPGAETVLGVTYGGKGLAPIRQALEDLAARPETAAHLARKLAVHFAADDPDADLVAALETVFHKTGGDLQAISAALVAHPKAGVGTKARQPFDLMVAALRALGVTPDSVMALEPRNFKRLILDPLAKMGQPFRQAPGPNGWPEREEDWITPQGLAARIDWAMQAPERLVRPLPDPRAFLTTALGDRADEALIWAVSAAESARDGVGLVLASPAFNRR